MTALVKAVFYIILIVGIVAVAASAEINVSQALSQTDIAFEDTTIFEIVLQWDGPQTTFRFDKPLNPLIDLMRVKGYSSSISSIGTGPDERTTKRYRYVLVPVQSGVGRIAPVSVPYVAWPDSIPGELVTEPMSVAIAKPIPRPGPGPGQKDSFPWIYIVIGLVAIGGGVVAAVLYRKPKVDIEPSQKPEENLLNGLDKLKADAGSDFKKFQSGLHSLLINYLKEKYGFETSQLNERTIESSLLDTKLSAAQQRTVAEWVVNAERDKFRPVSPAPGEAVRLESDVRAFFQRLK